MSTKTFWGILSVIIVCALVVGFSASTFLHQSEETQENVQKYYVARTGNIIEFCPEPASSERCLIFEVV